MKNFLLSVFFFFCTIPFFYAQQEDGVVSFAIPPGNSLKFNSFVINPTFSFVRQQSAYITLFNKTQWAGFENAPKTYMLSYSGRFMENEGVGISVFQQNQGLLTTFGVSANFAHNILLQEDSNLTFGINLSVYKSGLNRGKIISYYTYPDPSSDNIPSNTVMAVSPGINYGSAFFDFGLSLNNIVSYNFNTGILKDDPNKGIQAHVMYTGFIDSYGFFDKSKFSGILKTEFYKENTAFSGSGVFTIPKGIWVQAGYHSVLGMTAGFGLNITPKIALEYSYGMGLGDISNLGASHIIVLAYKFKNQNFDYGDDEEEGSLIEPAPFPKASTITKPKADTKAVADAKVADQAKIAEANKARLAAANKAKADAAIAKAKLAADAKAKLDAVAIEQKNKLATDAKAKADAAAIALAAKKPEPVSKTKLAADAKAKADADASAKRIADAKAKADAAAKLAADNKAKADADAAIVKIAAENKAKAAAAAKLAADTKIKADADAAAEKLAAENKAKADAAAKLAADSKSKADAESTAAQLAAENKAKADATAAKLAADSKAKADAEATAAKLAAENKAKEDAAAAAAKLVAENKAKEDAALKLAADAKAKADADATAAKLASENKAKADAAAAKLAADAKAKADAEATAAKLAAENKAKADAAAAKLAADAKAKADADAAAAKLAAENKAKADAAAAKLAADAKAKADAEAAAAQLIAENKAKADAAAAKLAADAKAKADAEATAAKLVAENKAKADAEATAAKLAAENKAKADAAAAKLAADAKAKADAEATAAKLAAENKAKADAEATAAKLAAENKAKADAAAAKLAADAKAKADAEATAAKLAAENKAKADAAAAKLAADAKAKADAEAAAAKLAAENKAKADATAAKLAADAKAKADNEAAAKLAAENKAKADAAIAAQAEQDRIEAAAAAKLAIEALAKAKADAMPKDEIGKTMDNLSKNLEDSKRKQQQLLTRLDASVANKEKALKDLKDENDLSDKGIVKTTVEFKSTAGENAELESIKAQIAQVNKEQAASLEEFNRLYAERLKKTPKNDLVNQNYLKTIETLKAEQVKAEQSNAALITTLEKIKVETEIEKKRRIKRAASLNDQDRLAQDMATLKRIKETTKVSAVPPTASDFDFGDNQANMQIIKNNKNVESGYYVILAVHSDSQKRDAFVTKTVASGDKNVNFFYDSNSSKYFIYEAKFDNLQEATQVLEDKGSKPYNSKMVIVKIEK
jgi:type IX secretion system PorP/SprF family membrane protein